MIARMGQEDESVPCELTRRSIVGGAASLAVVGCAGKAQKFDAKSVPTKDGIVEIDTKDYPDLVTPGGMVALKPSGSGKPVLVMRNEGDTFLVLSLKCTHLGCTVRWDDAEQVLRCPCHGSRFDDKGKVIEGPADEPLESFPSQLLGTKLQFKAPD